MNFKASFVVAGLGLLLGGVGEGFGQSITGFSPTFGSVGESVRIDGSGFTGVTNVIFFSNKSVRVVPTADTLINAVVPSGATTGPITVRKGATLVTTAADYTVIGLEPYVTDFSPISGAGGTVVTLNGVHFTGVTVAKFNGTNGTITQLTSDTQIKISAPAGVSTGPISLTRSNLTSITSSNFFAASSITSFSPGSGRPGTNVIISGKNFIGTTSVKFNGVAAPSFTVDSNTQITLTLWASATTGLINISAPGGQANSTSNFVVLPTILGFSPFFGKPGTNVTITGANLLGNTVVKFNGGPNATIVGTPTANQIVATVPANTTSGPISVTTTNGTVTTATNFFVPPGITFFTPNTGATGTNVTITGINFTNATVVSFNGVPATFVVVNNTTITATVPASATSGPISVTAPGGTAISSASFFVPPVVSGFNPTSGIGGNTVTVTGSSFTNATMVKFNGVNATNFTVVNNSQLTVVVPTNATTGPISVVAPGGTGISAENFVVDVLSMTVKRLTNSAVSISWPSSATGFALQANTNLSSTNWVIVTNVPVVVNGKNTVTNSTTNQATFYRLRK